MKQLLMLSVLLLGASWVVAQDSTPSGQSGSTTSSQTGSQSGSGQMSGGSHTVEGCLSGSGGQYTLTDKHGTAYQLTGDTSKLAEHVGHEIRVTGTESSASATGGSSDMGAGGQKTIEVSSMKHISKTCKNAGSTGGSMSH
ncbi:MAG TPA: DUF5818 domain-containing protein [Candidatus Sulfotelmatobacter sp.]|nr:DUF5818 domain-containing protein [Candidatus Sulfotelmatobacter sp.]